jgi:hypothetical protein
LLSLGCLLSLGHSKVSWLYPLGNFCSRLQ